MFGNEGKIHITFPRTHHPHGLMSLVYTKTLPLSGSKKIVSILPNILPCVKLIRMLFQWLWQKNMMIIKVGQLNGRQIFFKKDISSVNIHFATAIRYGRESSLGPSVTFGQVKSYILTNQEAIEFSVLIMSHVIDDLGKASNGVVYLQNSDQQLKKITKMSNSCECIPTGGRGLLQKNSKEQKR